MSLRLRDSVKYRWGHSSGVCSSRLEVVPRVLVIAPLGVSGAKIPVVTGPAECLVSRMAVDAGWGTGALSKRSLWKPLLEAAAGVAPGGTGCFHK